jgi:hypothetical protein
LILILSTPLSVGSWMGSPIWLRLIIMELAYLITMLCRDLQRTSVIQSWPIVGIRIWLRRRPERLCIPVLRFCSIEIVNKRISKFFLWDLDVFQNLNSSC